MISPLRSNAIGPQVDGQWHSVCIEWASGAVALSVDEVPLFTDLATPGFTPVASDIFAFAARTGGATETVLIDNISITRPNSVVLTEITYARTAGPDNISVDLTFTSKEACCVRGRRRCP